MPIAKVDLEKPVELSPQQKKIVDGLKERICGLLDEEAALMFADMDAAFIASEKEVFKFPASIKIEITPQGTWHAKAELSWGVRKKFSAEFDIPNQDEIPGI